MAEKAGYSSNEPQPPHTAYEHYSGSHSVPTVQGYLRGLKERDAAEDSAKKNPQPHEESGISVTDLQMKEEGPHQGKDDQCKKVEENIEGRRKVFDPVTGNREVEIEDASKDFLKQAGDPKLTVPNANIISEKPGNLRETFPSSFPDTNTVHPSRTSESADNGVHHPHTSPSQPLKEYAEIQDVTSPPTPVIPHSTSDVPLHGGEKTNLLFHPTPTISLSSAPVIRELEQKAQQVCICTLIFTTMIPVLAWVFLGGEGGFHVTIPIILFSFAAGVSISCVIWLWTRSILSQTRNIDWSAERQRGEIASANLIPESVEWLNTLIGVGWRLMNPDMFASVVDILEDVMQASIPGVIETVRVADISQGAIPMRLLSLRSLPDHHIGDDLKRGDMDKVEDKDQAEAERMGGEWYNLEASVAYHAEPTSDKVKGQNGAREKAKNMHLLVVFNVGIRGLFGIPIPIWVELKELVVTARIRLQVTPDPPYLGQLTFTLMGLPLVEVACLPMSRDQKGLNVLDLPLISHFVDSSVKTVASEYVAPRSMTLDLHKILQADDIKKETESLGVVMVRVKRAVGLSRQDRLGGGADSYVTLSWSKFGKPMYSTRVIVGDLNPHWEEVGFLLVKPGHVKAEENLSVELWDSDRFTSDDIVGKIEVPLRSLMLYPGKLHPQTTTKLSGLEHGSSMPGELYWEVGYFPKTTKFRPALRTSGEDQHLAGMNVKNHPELEDPKGSLDTKVEENVMHTPPDPLWPSGVLSIVIHQCVGLEVKSLKGTFSNKAKKPGREWEPGMDNAGELQEEEGGTLPSSYATITLNDQLIYRTRVKPVSSKPIFNAGTERFVRDWRTAHVTVCVRDSRLREHDPILGVVPIKISELLQMKSQVTRWFPLDAGLGFGRVRISILFRSVELTLPRELSGWDVGRIEFCDNHLSVYKFKTEGGSIDQTLTLGKIRMRTGGSVVKLQTRSSTATEENLRWTTQCGDARLCLPVKHRYMSPLIMEFPTTGGSVLPRLAKSHHGQSKAYCVLWLDNLVDHEPKLVKLPVFVTDKPAWFAQNYVRTDFTENNTGQLAGIPDGIKFSQVGWAEFRIVFTPSLCREHSRFAVTNDDRELFETWDACVAEGIRGVCGEDGRVYVGKPVQRLHMESIAQMKDDIEQTEQGGGISVMSEVEKQKLTDKYGVEWAGIVERAEKEFGLNNESNIKPESRRDSGYSHGTTDNYEYLMTSPETSSTESEEENEPLEEHPPGNLSSSPSNRSASKNPLVALKRYRSKQRNLKRNHQGLMQWKPIRSLTFAKDEVSFGVKKIKGKIKLKGREPDVETEV